MPPGYGPLPSHGPQIQSRHLDGLRAIPYKLGDFQMPGLITRGIQRVLESQMI